MSEIKIRAWDLLRNKMVTGEEIEETLNPDGSNVYYAGLSYGSVFVGVFDNKGDWHELPVMRWTSLTDKDGNPVFEGDILRDGTDMQFPITVDNTHGYRFMFGLDTFVAYNALSGEVIGDIYQDSHLLEAK